MATAYTPSSVPHHDHHQAKPDLFLNGVATPAVQHVLLALDELREYIEQLDKPSQEWAGKFVCKVGKILTDRKIPKELSARPIPAQFVSILRPASTSHTASPSVDTAALSHGKSAITERTRISKEAPGLSKPVRDAHIAHSAGTQNLSKKRSRDSKDVVDNSVDHKRTKPNANHLLGKHPVGPRMSEQVSEGQPLPRQDWTTGSHSSSPQPSKRPTPLSPILALERTTEGNLVNHREGATLVGSGAYEDATVQEAVPQDPITTVGRTVSLQPALNHLQLPPPPKEQASNSCLKTPVKPALRNPSEHNEQSQNILPSTPLSSVERAVSPPPAPRQQFQSPRSSPLPELEHNVTLPVTPSPIHIQTSRPPSNYPETLTATASNRSIPVRDRISSPSPKHPTSDLPSGTNHKGSGQNIPKLMDVEFLPLGMQLNKQEAMCLRDSFYTRLSTLKFTSSAKSVPVELSFSRKDAMDITNFFFVEVLGPKALERLQALVFEHEADTQTGISSSTVAKAEMLVKDSTVPYSARKFFDDFARTQRMVYQSSTQLHAFQTTVMSLRVHNRYNRLVNQASNQDSELVKALIDSGFKTTHRSRGVGWDSCVLKYLAHCLEITPSALKDNCNYYRGVARIADTFGNGILPILPSNTASKTHKWGIQHMKEVTKLLSEIVPFVRNTSDLLETHLYLPILHGDAISLNPKLIRGEIPFVNMENNAVANSSSAKKPSKKQELEGL